MPPTHKKTDYNSKYNFITKESRGNPLTHLSSSISQQCICQKLKSNDNFPVKHVLHINLYGFK